MDASAIAQALSACGLRVAFGEREILRGADLALAVGETVALVGRSGSGKTTLLKAICGLEALTEGSVMLHGRQIIEGGQLLCPYWEVTRQVVFVQQVPA